MMDKITNNDNKILVISAHPDDEVLGCGGIISKHTSNEDEVYLYILADGCMARYLDKDLLEHNKHKMKHNIKKRIDSAKESSKILGIKKVYIDNLLNEQLDMYPQLKIEINKLSKNKKINILKNILDKYEESLEFKGIKKQKIVLEYPYIYFNDCFFNVIDGTYDVVGDDDLMDDFRDFMSRRGIWFYGRRFKSIIRKII